jgi:CheY-like chemotaxis protein
MAKKILLADDSVTIQKVVELTFMDEDYEVSAVSNGDDALTRLDELSPDLVIADVHMPGANGYEVCRQAKERRPGLPVLLLVGTFEPFQEEEARVCGADGYLKKPFDSQELLRRVDELLAPPAAGDAAAEPTPAMIAPPAEESGPWGTPEGEPERDEEASAEEAWPGAAVIDPDDLPGDAAPALSVGAAEELELEASPWTEAEEEAAEEAVIDEAEVPLQAMEERLEPASGEPTPTAPRPLSTAAAPTPAPGLEGAAPAAGGVPLSDLDLERIARRVAEILGDGMLREVAWEVVPDLAELVIKDRIKELERQLE